MSSLQTRTGWQAVRRGSALLLSALLFAAAPDAHAHEVQFVVSNAYGRTLVQRGSGTFIAHELGAALDGVDAIHLVDIDDDSDYDVLAAAYLDDDVAWWENLDGSGTNWTRHDIALSFNGARSVHAGDVNGDTNTDVVAAAFVGDDITWWENTDGSATNWVPHVVATSFDGARSVVLADLDGDLDLDIVGAAYEADEVAWWENVGGDGTNWAKHVVTGFQDGARSVLAVDIDGDGDQDIAAAIDRADKVMLWRNTDGSGTNWEERTVDPSFDGVKSVHAADLDGDNDVDLVGAAFLANAIAWWENVNSNGTNWIKHDVADSFVGAMCAYAADVDGDGDMDVCGASSAAVGGGKEVAWWENLDGSATNWTKHLVGQDFDGGRSVHAADMDDDGKIDIAAAAYFDDEIAWWHNDLAELIPFEPPVDTNLVLTSVNTTCYVTNSPVTSGATQFVCTGWSRWGSAPGSGIGTSTTPFSLTNDAAIEWQWGFRYWLAADAGTNGQVATSNQWVDAGSNVLVLAVPDTYYHVAGWAGDTNGGAVGSNSIDLAMDGPREVTALFAETLAPLGTPLWWLALYGDTETNDLDDDGMLAWEEWVAGTVPTNDQSLFEISGFEVLTNSLRVLTWPSVTGRLYGITLGTNLSGTNPPITSALPATPAQNVYTTAPTGPTHGFYRITVERADE